MSQTFLGVDIQQSWEDLGRWEEFFKEYPIGTMIELGTGHGGLSLYLGLQCRQRGIAFHTFDNQKFMDFDNGLSREIDLASHFHFVDLFSKETFEELVYLLNDSPHPIAILFDDGDKPREFKIYAPYTAPGDFVIVHDWGTEFLPKDLGAVKVKHILGDIDHKESPPGWKAVWFKRV